MEKDLGRQASRFFQQGPDLRYLRAGHLEGADFSHLTILACSWPLGPPHGIEEAPVVHPLGPGRFGEVWTLHYELSHSQYALATNFHISRASPWPKRGTCGTPTWSWPPWRSRATSSLGFSWEICPTYLIWGLLDLSMALKRHMWYTNLVLATLERLSNLINNFVLANFTYLPNISSAGHL